jgi:hypothetical protein
MGTGGGLRRQASTARGVPNGESNSGRAVQGHMAETANNDLAIEEIKALEDGRYRAMIAGDIVDHLPRIRPFIAPIAQ